MRFRVIHIGKTSSSEVDGLCKEFAKRTKRFAKLEISTLPNVKLGNAKSKEITSKEGELILKEVASNEYLVLLDEKGKAFHSRAFANWIQLHFVHHSKTLVFVIGGAHGFSKEVYERADSTISLSKLTFNHELALLVLIEQVYRACTILVGHPYHND